MANDKVFMFLFAMYLPSVKYLCLLPIVWLDFQLLSFRIFIYSKY